MFFLIKKKKYELSYLCIGYVVSLCLLTNIFCFGMCIQIWSLIDQCCVFVSFKRTRIRKSKMKRIRNTAWFHHWIWFESETLLTTLSILIFLSRSWGCDAVLPHAGVGGLDPHGPACHPALAVQDARLARRSADFNMREDFYWMFNGNMVDWY